MVSTSSCDHCAAENRQKTHDLAFWVCCTNKREPKHNYGRKRRLSACSKQSILPYRFPVPVSISDPTSTHLSVACCIQSICVSRGGGASQQPVNVNRIHEATTSCELEGWKLEPNASCSVEFTCRSAVFYCSEFPRATPQFMPDPCQCTYECARRLIQVVCAAVLGAWAARLSSAVEAQAAIPCSCAVTARGFPLAALRLSAAPRLPAGLRKASVGGPAERSLRAIQRLRTRLSLPN